MCLDNFRFDVYEMFKFGTCSELEQYSYNDIDTLNEESEING